MVLSEARGDTASLNARSPLAPVLTHAHRLEWCPQSPFTDMKNPLTGSLLVSAANAPATA